MKIASFNIGHTVTFNCLDSGTCIYFEDLSRTFRIKNIALDTSNMLISTQVLDRISYLLDSQNPDYVAVSLNPGSYKEFLEELALLERFKSFEGIQGKSKKAYSALLENGLFPASSTGFLIEHGLAHIYSSLGFFNSPKEWRILGISLDGWSTVSHDTVVTIESGKHSKVERGYFPLGGTFFDQYLSFLLFGKEDLSAPGKIMGLSQYGTVRDKYVEFLSSLFFSRAESVNTFNELQRIMEARARITKDTLEFFDCGDELDRLSSFHDFLASAQSLFTKSIVESFDSLVEKNEYDAVCYAGGCGLSIVTNSALKRSLRIPLYIRPMADDSGQAIGAALYLNMNLSSTTNRSSLNPFIGEAIDIDKSLPISQHKTVSLHEIASDLANGKILGWFEGKHAIGPRALGHRSILASPAIKGMKEHLNSNIKHREWYRPYGAICRDIDTDRCFGEYVYSPYMLYDHNVTGLVANGCPECLNARGACRVQTISADDANNSNLYRLLTFFNVISGLPLLINTSLNCGGKPIVSSTSHALEDCKKMGIDILIYSVGCTLYSIDLK